MKVTYEIFVIKFNTSTSTHRIAVVNEWDREEIKYRNIRKTWTLIDRRVFFDKNNETHDSPLLNASRTRNYYYADTNLSLFKWLMIYHKHFITYYIHCIIAQRCHSFQTALQDEVPYIPVEMILNFKKCVCLMYEQHLLLNAIIFL